MVNIHGDRKSPRPGVVGPLPNHLNGLSMEITNHLLTGMILHIPPAPPEEKGRHHHSKPCKSLEVKKMTTLVGGFNPFEKY